jgi:23S rRNA pseudouridine955/2504/2580 synthase
MAVKYVEATSEDVGQRVDNFLMRQFRNVPKSLIYRVIRRGEVRINKGRVKQSTRIKEGDIVRLPPIRVPEKSVNKVPIGQLRRIEESILFEDNDLMVINKPSGMAVHGGSGISMGLIEILREMRPLAKRIELVHRLDRDTSGCILIAKKSMVLKNLHAQIRENKILKEYITLLAGSWNKHKIKIDLPLLKNTLQSGERMVKIDSNGKPSTSFFNLVTSYKDTDLVKVRLKTGRTHQIRVHALSQGCPVIGDDKYGNKTINKQFKKYGMKRLALHAQFLGFKHPNIDTDENDWIKIEAPLHDDFKAVINYLEKEI